MDLHHVSIPQFVFGPCMEEIRNHFGPTDREKWPLKLLLEAV